ncbi:MAG: ankyrin repeat domain-containing protein [Fimbriimonadales bacterium]
MILGLLPVAFILLSCGDGGIAEPTAMNASLRSTKTSLIVAVRKNDFAAVKGLLSKGANPNVKNAAGSPILCVAAGGGYTAIVAALLEAGADPNAKNADLETPLHATTKTEIARLLLKKGADPNVADANGHTALIGAAMTDDAKLTEVLLKAGANPRAATARGETALHWAAGNASIAIAEMLLERGVLVDARDWGGMTPLMRAVGPRNQAQRQLQIGMVKYLISKGATVNAKMDQTRIEYFGAGVAGDKEAMKRIEESGKLLVLREDGPSVLKGVEDEEIRTILRKAGARE